MKRTLTFPIGQSKNQQRFETLTNALLVVPLAPNGALQPARGLPILRQEARLQELLDGISEENTDLLAAKAFDGTAHRTVRHGTSIDLLQEDFALLESRAKTIDWQPTLARRVVDVVDWLSTAPTID